jgi:tungstate transport system permease protein
MDLLWQGVVRAIQLILGADPELIRVSGLSLAVSLAATLIAAMVGVPLGVALAMRRFPAHKLVQILVNTGMGLPPVLVGLFITILLWRTGPFGFLELLYTPQAMVLAQFVVATPLTAGLTRLAVDLLDPNLAEAMRVCGARDIAIARELVRAALPQILVAILAAFGRAIGEVGASLMVGGNILGQTRILTTAIALETSRGDFAQAIALGLVLVAIAFLVNLGLSWRDRIYRHADSARTGR